LNIFAKSWQENLIRNLYPAMKAISLSDMARKLHCPVIVASGGPSLTKQLPLLKEVKNKALILCAGSTINSLLSYGIKPHAVVTIDGSEANYLHFKGVDLHDVPLFYGLTTYWMIPAEHQGLHVIFDISQNKELNGWLFKMINKPLLNVMGGISVATFTLDVGRILSSGPICVIGQDLAFTGNRTHAEGNRLGKTVHVEELENRRDTLYVKGYYGEQVLTNYQFLAMKQAFEEYLSYMKSKGDHHLFVNATEGGVWIEGMEHMSFRDFVETYCQEDVSCQLAELFSQETAEPDWQRFFESIQEELVVLSRIEKLARRAGKEIEKAGKSGMTERRLEKLNQLDEELKKLLQNDFMSYILNPVIYKVTQQFLPEENETPYETQLRILKQSETLYRELQQAAVFTKYCFEQLLEQVKPHLP